MPESEAKDCLTCDCGDEESGADKCPESERLCGHHCNHSLTHDGCCWCGKIWGEQ